MVLRNRQADSLAIALAAGGALLLAAAPAVAKEYNPDPFNDRDFDSTPILLAKTRSTAGRLELGAMFATSVVEKYMRHLGGLATVDYHFSDYLALELYGGYFYSDYTAIVTSEGGIIGNIQGSGQQRDPNIPDRKMLTWLADAVVIFSPIYGKINFVSELDFSLNLYVLAGAGLAGMRHLQFDFNASAGAPEPVFNSVSAGAGPNAVWGFGLKLFLTDWMTLRLEFRDINYLDKFDFNQSGSEATYIIKNHTLNLGLTFLPF